MKIRELAIERKNAERARFSYEGSEDTEPGGFPVSGRSYKEEDLSRLRASA